MSPRQDGRYDNPAWDGSDNGYRNDNRYREEYRRDNKSRWPEERSSRDRYSDRGSDRYNRGSNGSKYERSRHDSYRDSRNGTDDRDRSWRNDERTRDHGPIINDERQNKWKNDHNRITSQDQVEIQKISLFRQKKNFRFFAEKMLYFANFQGVFPARVWQIATTALLQPT